jgi:hypothetical protein
MIQNLTISAFGQDICIHWDEGDDRFHVFADPTSLTLITPVLFKNVASRDGSSVTRRLDATAKANAATIMAIKTHVRNNRLVETFFERQRNAPQPAMEPAALSYQRGAGPTLYAALSDLLKVAKTHLSSDDPRIKAAENALKYAETGMMKV